MSHNAQLLGSDQQARERALDLQRSFIVQAPAGSGKTELLTRRLLRQLAHVSDPGAILAITFTQKAAAEMRQRVLSMLRSHSQDPDVQAVLKRDQQQQWGLLAQPAQLNIQTIDGLCYELAQHTGSQRVLSDPEPLYQQAVQQLLDPQITPPSVQQALHQLLCHWRVQWDHLSEQLVHLLAQRALWLPHRHNTPADCAQALQQALRHAVHHLQTIWAPHWPAWCEALSQLEPGSCGVLHDVPHRYPDPPDDVAVWQALSHWLLTQDGQWRRRWTRVQGILPPSSAPSPEAKQRRLASKKHVLQFVEHVQQHAHLQHALMAVRDCPSRVDTDDLTWHVLSAWLVLLPHLAASLHVVFQEEQACDFNELVVRALDALGDHDAPSDVALALEHRVQHILMDEFQDTSVMQWKLLERLVAGWAPGDQHTLLLVGDPMQSVYRFRQADVSLFQEAIQHGVQSVPLEWIQLHANFRSTPHVVQWINECASSMFPSGFDLQTHAVPYTQSVAAQQTQGPVPSEVQVVHLPDTASEMAHMAQVIHTVRAAAKHATIGVLLPTRKQAAQVLRTLTAHGIPHRAVDMVSMAQRPWCLDLTALLKALCNLHDRVAWLSVLRAPWCGVSLADLTCLAGERDDCIWERMGQGSVCAQLSQDGRMRVRAMRPVLQQALDTRDQQPIASWLAHTWRALRGDACMPAHDNDPEPFFALLEQHTQSGYHWDEEAWSRALHRADGACSLPGESPVEVMTVHKSKGLAFDVVLVPGLGASSSSRDPYVWVLDEHWVDHQTVCLWAMQGRPGDDNTVYRFVSQRVQHKAKAEKKRLLYVSMTRARYALHLLSSGSCPQGSWIHEMGVQPVSHSTPNVDLPAQHPAPAKVERLCKRLPLSQLPSAPVVLSVPSPPPAPAWSQAVIGRVVHAVLKQVHDDGVWHWPWSRMASQQPVWKQWMQQSGITDPAVLEEVTHQVQQWLKGMWDDPMGCWLLRSDHPDSHAEQPLQHLGARLVPDRVFLDAEGTRWIVDYKTSLEYHQEAYAQLARYADCYRAMGESRVVCGVYHVPQSQWIPLPTIQGRARGEKRPAVNPSVEA